MCANVLSGTLPGALLIWYPASLLNKSAPVPRSASLTDPWPAAYQTSESLRLIGSGDVCLRAYGLYHTLFLSLEHRSFFLLLESCFISNTFS